MKKIIILLIGVLSLTGCQGSGHLTNTCVKEERTSTLKSITTYTIGFEKDVVDNVDILYDYQDSNTANIDALRLSIETQNKYWNVAYEVLENTRTQYKIIYHISKDSEEEIKEYFGYQEKRSKWIPSLKEKDFICK